MSAGRSPCVSGCVLARRRRLAYMHSFPRTVRSCPAWRASPSKTASRKSRTASTSCCSPPSEPATSPAAKNSPSIATTTRTPSSPCAKSPRKRSSCRGIEQDLIRSLSRAPEPEPADEEVLDLIPTDQNIFGLQDVSAEEEAAALAAEAEELSPEDLEAAIEAELGGKAR